MADVEVEGTLTIAGEDVPQDFTYQAVFSRDTLTLMSYLSIGGYVFNGFEE